MEKIITEIIEFLPTLKLKHLEVEDCWYSCPKSENCCYHEQTTHGDIYFEEGEEPCYCGADEHNTRIDQKIKELEELRGKKKKTNQPINQNIIWK